MGLRLSILLPVDMKPVGHTDNQTAASIYTHTKEDMHKKASVNPDDAFGKRAGEE